jgi:hypothetical protein
VDPAAAQASAAAARMAALLEQARSVRERMLATAASLDSLAAGFDAATADGDAQLEYHLARIRAVFGNDFPVLPRFTAANSADLAASLAEQTALCHGDPLAPQSWLQRLALVRPDTDRLQRTLTAAELLGVRAAPADFRVAQLPHVPGQRWAALPRDADTEFTAELALAFHAPGGFDPAAPLAGLVCDDWAETIPDAEQVTGLSFHYDAPGARAPNAVLLAVAADPATPSWSFDELLDVVREAASLAKLRMVGPRQLESLGVLLPTTYLPENFRGDVPSVPVTKLTANLAAAVGVLGKAT